MTRINPNDPPERLAQIEHKQFYNLVDADLRRRIDPTVSDKLRHPAVAMRWHIVLLQMRRSTEGAIASKKSEFQASRAALLDEIEKMEAEIIDAGDDGEYVTYTPAPSVDGPRSPKQITIDEADRKIEMWRGQLRDLLIEYEEWRVKSLRFKAGVDEKVAEAEWARHLAERSILESAAIQERTMLHLALGAARAELDAYRAAIDKHRAGASRANTADRELWAVLDAYDDDSKESEEGGLGSPGAEVRRLLGG